jgi:hypothetical protein
LRLKHHLEAMAKRNAEAAEVKARQAAELEASVTEAK